MYNYTPPWDDTPGGNCERSTEPGPQSLRISAVEGDLGHPDLLQNQRAAGVLHRADRLQPTGHRPVGSQLPVHRVLRLVGRCAPARLHAGEQTVRRVRQQRGDQQLPAARRRGTAVHRVPLRRCRRPADGRDGVLRRGDRGDLPRTRLQADPADRRAPSSPRLQDRHDPARRGGRRAVGAQRARKGRQLRRAHRTGDRCRLGVRPGRADTVRRLGEDDVLHRGRGRLGQGQQEHRR